MARLGLGVLSLLVVLACVNWCDALRCAPCDKSKCTPLTRRDCPNGVGKDICNCCDRCFKGLGEVCGGPWNSSGVCGKGLECPKASFNDRAKCVKKTKPGTCPENIFCIQVIRPPPTNCGSLGYSKPICGCFAQCNKAGGDECGYKLGNCRPGYFCKGFRFVRRGDKVDYFDGECVKKEGPNGKCPYGIRCNRRRCPQLRCLTAKAPCACCPTCLSGRGGPCGLKDGVCNNGLVCRGDSVTVRDGRPIFRSGKCVPKQDPQGCYRRQDCRVVRCAAPPTGCRYGAGKSPCGCCSACLRGPNQTCGLKHSGYLPCGRGLRCVGEITRGRYRPGRCQGPSPPKPLPGSCPCLFPCPRILCRTPRNCKFGYSKSKCGCCPQCRKGNGEECGARRGDCRLGFVCRGTRLTKDDRNRCIFKSGICRPKKTKPGQCPLPVFCTKILRPRPTNCRYGFAKMTCGCDWVCNKGHGQECGYKKGKCRKGYYCRGQRFVWRGDDLRFISGICVRRGCRRRTPRHRRRWRPYPRRYRRRYRPRYRRYRPRYSWRYRPRYRRRYRPRYRRRYRPRYRRRRPYYRPSPRAPRNPAPPGGSPLPTGCPPNCAAVSCLRVENCPYGTGLDRCGCCVICLPAPN